MLKIAATANYTSVLQTAVPEAQDLGSVVVYKVVSRWRFARGTVILRYSDFRRMHSTILKSLTGPECAKLLERLPTLPGKGIVKVMQNHNAAFIAQRRVALEAYIHSLSALLTGTPMMQILLETIGLAPRTTAANVEAKKRARHSDFQPINQEFNI